jgi:hypothetical protein
MGKMGAVVGGEPMEDFVLGGVEPDCGTCIFCEPVTRRSWTNYHGIASAAEICRSVRLPLTLVTLEECS